MGGLEAGGGGRRESLVCACIGASGEEVRGIKMNFSVMLCRTWREKKASTRRRRSKRSMKTLEELKKG